MGMLGDRIRKRSLHLRFRRHDKDPHNTFGRAKLRTCTGCAHTLFSLYLAFEISPLFWIRASCIHIPKFLYTWMQSLPRYSNPIIQNTGPGLSHNAGG